MITDVSIPRAGDNNAIAMDFATAGRLKGQQHLGPRRKTRGTSEFDAVFVKNNGVLGEG